MVKLVLASVAVTALLQAASVFSQEGYCETQGADFNRRYDIASVAGDSVGACREACDDNDACNAVQFLAADSKCFLKNIPTDPAPYADSYDGRVLLTEGECACNLPGQNCEGGTTCTVPGTCVADADVVEGTVACLDGCPAGMMCMDFACVTDPAALECDPACAAGEVCNAGVCAADTAVTENQALEGEACSDATPCSGDLVCAADVCAATGIPEVGVEGGAIEGAACAVETPCAVGLICDEATTVCAVAPDAEVVGVIVGGACGLNTPCGEGLVCDANSLCNVPPPAGTRGGSCSATVLCNDGLVCGTDSLCEPAPAPGTIGGVCDAGVPCTDAGTSCVAGQCTIPADGTLGGACSAEAPCTESITVCAEAICQLPGAAGEACTDALTCFEGLACTAGFCSLGAVGAPCDDVLVCATGLECDAATCAVAATGVALGASCDDDNTCAEGLVCDATSVCAEPIIELGGTCSELDATRCAEGTTCQRPANVCTPPFSVVLLGATCDKYMVCAPGAVCNNAVCEDAAAAAAPVPPTAPVTAPVTTPAGEVVEGTGEPCSDVMACSEETVCVADVCSVPTPTADDGIALGAECLVTQACTTGTSCVNGVCSQIIELTSGAASLAALLQVAIAPLMLLWVLV